MMSLKIYPSYFSSYPEENSNLLPPSIESQNIMFHWIHGISVNMTWVNDDLVMNLQNFPEIYHMYLLYVHPGKYWSRVKGWNRDFRGAYLVHINGNQSLMTDDFIKSLATSIYIDIYYYRLDVHLFLILKRAVSLQILRVLLWYTSIKSDK